jgi:glycosyltransferase involved in cell wall biosynthesis
MVTTCQGDDRIATCLTSLAAQTLAPEAFEILVVQNGPPCRTPDIVRQFAADHPRLRVRILELSEPGLSNARNVGLQAARGTYVTYVDDDDWVTPGFLQALLSHAEDGVVPVALVSTVPEGAEAHTAGGALDLDNYASKRLLPLSGQRVLPHRASAALQYNAGKLIRTELARRVRYDVTLRSGEDFVYWLALLALEPFDLRIVDPADDAVYCRSVRERSLGRQGTGYDFLVTQRLACLVAIEALHTRVETVARVAHQMRYAQASWINQYLALHPDEHARVFADARALGLRDTPWHDVHPDACPPVVRHRGATTAATGSLRPVALRPTGGQRTSSGAM